jgi:hypothetical protein
VSDNTNTDQVKAGAGAPKNTSHVAQIVAAVWIGGWSAFKFVTNPQAIGLDDVVLSGAGIAACFLPVYFSIFMDKIKDIRIGGAK